LFSFSSWFFDDMFLHWFHIIFSIFVPGFYKSALFFHAADFMGKIALINIFKPTPSS